MNFSKIPCFDNHAHSIDGKQTTITPFEFLKGYQALKDRTDPPSGDLRDPLYGGFTEELILHTRSTGVVYSTICHLARLFNCEPTLESVIEQRNRYTEQYGIQAYSEMLYKEGNLIGGVLETDNPIGEDVEDKMPEFQVFRLYSFDHQLFRLLKETKSYHELWERFSEDVRKAFLDPHYTGIKCHLSEVFSHSSARPVYSEEAESVFASAKALVRQDLETVYMALLTDTMLLCQELDVPLHIHSGITGHSTYLGEPGIAGQVTVKAGSMFDGEPFALARFLTKPEFRNTKVVFLHAGYPWLRNLSMMAAFFPNVYIDMSCALSWTSLASERTLEELMSYAPFTKIVVGSGQGGIPEKGWMAAKTARNALTAVLNRAVENGFMSEQQAQETAENILYKNAMRLHKHFTV
ncbi:MAG: amidohydrolase [Faecalicatena sp.]|uniref:amidohydrolase family protein n=1 Tax=Faecalicatena sp. TaxID=2005360 RepID=UPI00258F75CC|nr:amidohydrolase family protein [Faecalicatena sp.]MCI6465427.1 amidohydrolase [Faecalicatena sp.]MDY5617259.1 amidohydrolase family protein [Lachnospiraceae bacterium]